MKLEKEVIEMKRFRSVISLICIIALLTSICILPAYAMPAPPKIHGTDIFDVIIKEKDSPIIIDNEIITFDLPTLPYAKYYKNETFHAYDSRVTSEYTFYNPTDATVTATLLVRSGTVPYYGIGIVSKSELLEKYGIFVNGEKIEPSLRATSYIEYSNVDLCIDALSDEFIKDDFYTPDLTVTKYSYEVKGDSKSNTLFKVNVGNIGAERKILTYDGNLYTRVSDSGGNYMESGIIYNKNKETVYFYVLGKPLDTEPDDGCLYASAVNSDTQLNGEFRYLGSESTTLKDFIFREYDSESGITEVDWYNSCVALMKESERTRGSASSVHVYSFIPSTNWFEYKIVLAPGERVTSTVTAPMYPKVNKKGTSPYSYSYTYYLSPARNWAESSNLEIVVNTPYEMKNIEGFEKTDTGYKLVREGVPENEDGYTLFKFLLLNDGNTPLKESNPGLFARISSFFKSIYQKVINFFTIIFS